MITQVLSNNLQKLNKVKDQQQYAIFHHPTNSYSESRSMHIKSGY